MTLATGDQRVFRLEDPGPGRWRLWVDQAGVDVSVHLESASVDGPGASILLDSPLDRDGPELLLLPKGLGEARVTVLARATAGKPGSVRLRLDPVAEGDIEALATMTRAGQAYARGGGEGRRQALETYREGVEQWKERRRPRLAATCLYATAVLHRLLGEAVEARALARQVLPLWQSLGDLGREADTWNELGLAALSAGDTEAARAALSNALAVQERLGDPFRAAATVNNLCLTHLYDRDPDQAITCYGPAIERIRAAGDGEHEAVALSNLGSAFRLSGRPVEALEAFEQARRLHQAAGRDSREAQTLNNLALLHRNLDEPHQALEHYLRALTLLRRQGDRRWEARVLHNLGTVYHLLRDLDRAKSFYLQALKLRQQLGDRPGEATTLRLLGVLDLGRGRVEEAVDTLEQALAAEHATEDSVGAAVVSSFLARAENARGRPEAALTQIREALTVLRPEGEPRDVAHAELVLGEAALALGDWTAAAESMTRAEKLFEQLDTPRGEVTVQLRRARLAEAQGDTVSALHQLATALDRFEALRQEVPHPHLRATYSASLHAAYRQRIRLLLEKHRASGDPASLQAALETSERHRAVALAELGLPPSPTTGTQGGESKGGEATARWRTAQRRLHQRTGERRRLLATQAPQPDVLAADTAVFDALTELEAATLALRRSRGTPPVVTTQPLDTRGIQRQLDPGTALLEIVLGETQSEVFAVTRDALRVFPAPAGPALEALAQATYEGFLGSANDPTAAGELSRQLLGSVLTWLTTHDPDLERLAIVADGALHTVPFGALPDPAVGRSLGAPAVLLDRFEIVQLPSMSVLAALRRRAATRQPAPRWAAVLADPVFDSRDARTGVSGGLAMGSTEPRPVLRDADARQPLDLELPRLRSSRREADLLAALAPTDEVLVALDFEVDRALVFSGRLADYRVLHLATHGVIDTRTPALSGLALSQVDRQGNPRQGFLRLHDLPALPLRAELVVLSACRTALGQEIQGEGLVGMSQGFLRAGAQRLLASLWSVPDAATAELMQRFYRALVVEGLSPAAALRSAQRSMRQERRWHAPRNWAGFVLLGDWRSGDGLRPPQPGPRGEITPSIESQEGEITVPEPPDPEGERRWL